MKAAITQLLVTCFFCLTLSAQHDLSIQWQRTIGTMHQERFDDIVNDARNVVVACADGGYAVALLRPSNPASTCDRATWTSENLWLIKFNKFGVTEWERCYGAQFQAFWMYVSPGGLIQTADGGFLIVGGTSFTDGDFATNHGAYDAFAIKTTATGVKEWSRCYGGSSVEGFSSVVQDHDGGYVIAGMAGSGDGDVVGVHWLGSFGKDAWIVKINATGGIVWQKCVDNQWGEERFSSVKRTSDSGFVAVGNITARFSKTGALLWQRSESVSDLAIDRQNNVFLTMKELGAGALIRKLSPSGNLLWTRNLFPGLPGPEGISLQLLNDTTIMVAGKTNDPAHMLQGMHWTGLIWNNYDIFLAQIDTAANISMFRCFGGTDLDEPTHFVPTQDKGFVVLGLSKSSDGDVLKNYGNVDYWLIKVGNFNTVKGKLFYDYNNNGQQDAGEDPFINTFITSEKRGSLNGWFSTDGRFQYTVDTGALVTKPLINHPYYTINPATLTTSHTTYGNTDSVAFAVVPLPGITDLSVSLGAQSPQRPGFANQLYLVITNNGTKVIHNAVVGIRPDPKMIITAHDSAGFSRTQDTLFWQFNNLEPRKSKTVTISTRNPAPPAMVIGDSLLHYILARPFSDDSTDADNRDTVRQNIIGSFDPNNKLDDVGGILYNDRYTSGDQLLYTINFQNTGTDTAFTVVIRDTLTSLFNIQSLQMVSASHPYTLGITGNRLQWTFKDILLVDSTTNEPKSHGYVMFRIKPKAGLNVNQVLFNSASIYFDYNLPVLTNKNEVKISVRPLAKPILANLSSAYCKKPGTLQGKVMNPPVQNSGVTMLVKLDNTVLPVAADSTFNFDVSSLTAGVHLISVRYTQGAVSTLTEWTFTVTEASVLDLQLSANTTTVTNPTLPVVITGSNASGGTNLFYSYAKDRNFTALLKTASSDNVLNLDPTTLVVGVNTIYGRIHANGQCYTEPTNTDSIQIELKTVTGIVDVDAPQVSINVYPLPFKDYLTIQGLLPSKTYRLTLVSAQGNEIKTATVKNQSSYTIKTEELPAGVYVLRVLKEQRHLGAMQVIKQ